MERNEFHRRQQSSPLPHRLPLTDKDRVIIECGISVYWASAVLPSISCCWLKHTDSRDRQVLRSCCLRTRHSRPSRRLIVLLGLRSGPVPGYPQLFYVTSSPQRCQCPSKVPVVRPLSRPTAARLVSRTSRRLRDLPLPDLSCRNWLTRPATEPKGYAHCTGVGQPHTPKHCPSATPCTYTRQTACI